LQTFSAGWDPAVRSSVEAMFLAGGRPYAADTFRRVELALDGYTARWAGMRKEACARVTDVDDWLASHRGKGRSGRRPAGRRSYAQLRETGSERMPSAEVECRRTKCRSRLDRLKRFSAIR
jgi:hypothetical protein